MVDVGTDIGQQRARYIIDHSARHWTAKQDGGLVTFTFAPDQECFTEHRVALDRAPIYTLGRGDWRSATRPAPVDGEEWLDRFRANQENLSAQHRMG